MIIQPHTSYSVIMSSVKITNMVINYIINLNIQHERLYGNHLTGDQIIQSNSAKPNKRTIVVSSIDRNTDDFIKLSDNQWNKIFSQILDFQFSKANNLLMRKLDLDQRFDLYLSALKYDDEIDVQQFIKDQLAIMKQSKYKYFENIDSVFNFINTLSKNSANKLSNIKFNILISIYEKILTKDLSQFYLDKYKEMLDSVEFDRNLLKTSISLSYSTSLEEFQLRINKNLK